MADRQIPDIPKYRGSDPHVAAIFDKLRTAISHLVNTDFVTEKDIYCPDLITNENSIYIGSKDPQNKLENIEKELYWNKVKIVDNSATIAPHASNHEDGGPDELSHDDLADSHNLSTDINHDALFGFESDEHLPALDEDDLVSDSATHVATQQSIKAYVDGKTVDVPVCLQDYDPSPARSSESNIHGGILSLATGQALDSVPTDLPVTKGIGKLIIVINAGTDIAGEITVTGETIDRNTGASTPADTDTITVDALTTDNSDTDTNGNTRHAFEGAYITSKWFTGSVTLSTTNLTLTDVDVYHVSFEQFGDQPGITLDAFDANIFTTNVAAEFDAYLYSLEVTGDKCDVTREASLNVGADGETAIADRYWRLRRGNIAKALDGTSDGIWVDVHYSNSPAYVEDVTLKVWATIEKSLA